MKETAHKGNILILILIVLAVSIGLFSLLKLRQVTPLQQSLPKTQSSQQDKTYEKSQPKEYTSKDLKISFKYPKWWFVNEKDYDIMLTSYETRIGENKPPNENELKIFIKNYSGCFLTLEEDLIDPACGQGKVKNKIISKEAKQTPGGEFLKYTLDSYDENQRIQYFFQKGEKILDIEKHPNPSQFEKEFDEIVNSIKFL